MIELATKLEVFKKHQIEAVLVGAFDFPTAAAVIGALRNVSYDVTGPDHAVRYEAQTRTTWFVLISLVVVFLILRCCGTRVQIGSCRKE
jgi:hypothetical protein